MLISHLCIAWIQCENYQDVCLLVKAHFGWARFGWAGDLSQAKLGVSPHWDHYEVRALIFPELLQQPGQGDGVGKTIKKAREKKNQNQIDKIKDFCSWHSERTDPFRSIRTFLSLTHCNKGWWGEDSLNQAFTEHLLAAWPHKDTQGDHTDWGRRSWGLTALDGSGLCQLGLCALGKLLSNSLPQFSHLHNGDDSNRIYRVN